MYDQNRFKMNMQYACTLHTTFKKAMRCKMISNFYLFLFRLHRGNVVGVDPYRVGTPSCSSFGMHPSSRYSGLCINSRTVYTPQSNYITQNTYTFKSERLNPVRYETYKTNSIGGYVSPYNSGYYSYKPAVQTQNTAVQVYQRALQTYNNPHQSYDQALQNYQSVLQAYATAYSPPQSQPQQSYYSRSTAPTSYDWSSYFGK